MEASAKPLPDHPFAHFSLDVCRLADNQKQFQHLQNRYHYNSNVVLFCIWLGVSNRGRLTLAECRTMLEAVQPWHERLVETLRNVRKKLQGQLRDLFLKEEMTAEHIEQLFLVESIYKIPQKDRNHTQQAQDACRNIALYSKLAKRNLSTAVQHILCDVLASIFPKVNMPSIAKTYLQVPKQFVLDI